VDKKSFISFAIWICFAITQAILLGTCIWFELNAKQFFSENPLVNFLLTVLMIITAIAGVLFWCYEKQQEASHD
jgi:Trk-type K+ transport system membrane component